MRQPFRILLIVTGWSAAVGIAAAQNPYPYNYAAPQAQYPYQGQAGQYQRPPALSPYLNLNNRGNPAINYFNFVAPQLQANQGYGGPQGPAISGLQPGDEATLDPQDPTSRVPRSSAHQSTFNNTGPYFNSLGTIGFGQGRQQQQQQPQTGKRR